MVGSSFAFSKIKQRGSALFLRASTPTSTPITNSKATITVKANATLPSSNPDLGDVADVTSVSNESSTIITYESSSKNKSNRSSGHDDNSTLSSIHSDSLTSFAGNLTPPKIEFLSGNNHADGIININNTNNEDTTANDNANSILCRHFKKNQSFPDRQERQSKMSPLALAEQLAEQVRSALTSGTAAVVVGRRLESETSSPTMALPISRRRSKACSKKKNSIKVKDASIKEQRLLLPTDAKVKIQPYSETSKKSNGSSTSTSPSSSSSPSKKKSALEKSKSSSLTPSKKNAIQIQLKTDIVVGNDQHTSRNTITTVNIVTTGHSSLLEGLSPTVEVGQESAHDESLTEIRQEVVRQQSQEQQQPQHQRQPFDAYNKGGGRDAIPTTTSGWCNPLTRLFPCEVEEEDDGSTTIVQGKEFPFEKPREKVDTSKKLGRPRESGRVASSATDTTTSSVDSSDDGSGDDSNTTDDSESTYEMSNKVGTEIIIPTKKKYQTGQSVVKHLETLYNIKKKDHPIIHPRSQRQLARVVDVRER